MDGKFFKSAIPEQRQQLLSRQAGLIVFGREMSTNANDNGRLASANGVVFDLAIDLFEFQNAITVMVPAREMIFGELD
jgi:hypothetical protein